MPLSLICASCDHQCNVADNLAGRKIKCPKCGAVLNVPDDEEGESAPQVSARGSRKTQPDEGADERPAPKNPRREDGQGNRPRRKAGKKAGNKGLIIGLAVGGVLAVVLVVGIVLLVLFLRGGGGIFDNPNATEDNFDKIKAGMTKEEVEKILDAGQKVSRAEVFKALHDPLPKEGVGSDGLTLKWKNQTDTILLEMHPPPGKTAAQGWVVAHGWFVREQGGGQKPKYKLLGFGKLK
jgi:phage FluMu protein Com